ncbi:hypothetical protein HMPREF9120_00593 [Neisseria sp. oral taxon 020 str. F0370]|nr:hypothetical protein HMPREF9120_00593 [Neisseria sp. oral taxon 020 str. F0370]
MTKPIQRSRIAVLSPNVHRNQRGKADFFAPVRGVKNSCIQSKGSLKPSGEPSSCAGVCQP